MEIATSRTGEGRRSALFEDVYLVGSAVPDVSVEGVDLRTSFLSHDLEAPLLIAGMTGGHDGAMEVNRNLAIAADTLGIAIGAGSQRAALMNDDLARTYAVLREYAPHALLIGNLGICQLVPQGDDPPFDREAILRAIEMIEADALAVHLNIVEELIQPEGDRNTTGLISALGKCVEWSPVPVIAKETGAGMASEAAHLLAKSGLSALDIGGVGGTSFARVEGARAEAAGDKRGIRLGTTFGDWGLPTVLSIIESRSAGLPLIATGGIRNGLHAAKALALGAAIVGIGSPALKAAQVGPDAVIEEISLIIEELRVAMVLCDVASIDQLRSHVPVITGRAAEWLRERS